MPADRIRLIVADDEALARRLVKKYASECADVEVVRECADTRAVAAALLEVPAEAALLDVRMPGPDLFDLLTGLRPPHPLPALIFATAYDRYAVRAFELNAVDYLVKPFTAARFAAAVARLRERRQQGEAADGVSRLLRDLGPRPDRLLVPDGSRMVPLAVGEIGWIRSEDDYARIHTAARSYLVYRTLNDLEARLDPAEFLRVHRSAIVRLDQIVEVQSVGSSRYRLTLRDGTTLIVSRSRALALKRLIL
jgi:two-component system LytT family response regulator